MPKKQTKYIWDKILLYEARAEFCQIFRLFFGAMEFQEKNAFGIYWPLPSFAKLIWFVQAFCKDDGLLVFDVLLSGLKYCTTNFLMIFNKVEITLL